MRDRRARLRGARNDLFCKNTLKILQFPLTRLSESSRNAVETACVLCARKWGLAWPPRTLGDRSAGQTLSSEEPNAKRQEVKPHSDAAALEPEETFQPRGLLSTGLSRDLRVAL